MVLYTPIHNAIIPIPIKIIAFNFYYTIEAFDYFTLYVLTKLVYKNVFFSTREKKNVHLY